MELWDDLLSAGLLASLEALFSLDLMSDVLYDSHLAAVEGGRAGGCACFVSACTARMPLALPRFGACWFHIFCRLGCPPASRSKENAGICTLLSIAASLCHRSSRTAMLRRNAGGSTRVDRVRVLGSRLVRDLFEARPQLAGERQVRGQAWAALLVRRCGCDAEGL